MPSARGNAFTITYYPTDQQYAWLGQDDERFWSFHQAFANNLISRGYAYAGQWEQGEKEEKWHIQAFAHKKSEECQDIRTFTKSCKQYIKKIPTFPNVRTFIQMFPNEYNINYCCSWTNPQKPTATQQIYQDGFIPWERCNPKTRQGTRSDLRQAAEVIRDTGDVLAVFREMPGTLAQYRGLRDLARDRMYSNWVDRVKEVFLLWGWTGAGKSWAARREFAVGSTHTVPAPNESRAVKWFGNYQGQETIIFEEFNWRYWPITTMNEILDQYKIEVKVCGGHVPNVWKRVIICSNEDPKEWWPKATPVQRSAFNRRINRVIHWAQPVNVDFVNLPAQEERVPYTCASKVP